ncbi:DUF3168 domain-containing protein [Vibrio coralliilyticus]|uniref:DUF3168 domain-containing protein n=1 Tax=Vibrio coralliilyticus TaxID=190893 RepID=UPI00183F366A|nr:DUF3168 domain-containing protein [Vibrio coralliilyticus]NUW66957.1 DUF3168 domain-containing protein [Vibrio coralliilyticus]NUW69151.1 DUF3168 domain-containing protein [Vibrio coralliilyticus]
MGLEARIVKVLEGYDVFPTHAPLGTPTPYVIYHLLGGEPLRFLDGTRPDQRHAEVQISVFADTVLAANQLAREVEDRLCHSDKCWARPLTEAFDIADETPAPAMVGKSQDFSIWYPSSEGPD